MFSDLSNEQLRAISPFFVKDTDVLLFENGQFQESDAHAKFAAKRSFRNARKTFFDSIDQIRTRQSILLAGIRVLGFECWDSS